ncbi:DivIVA domain-containing protein [Numidum massiliense]|uniref:DivIVA domain-containing protein n=1 Tax=Numidum massiliense TaxID=1522315 RepID=UPI0006D5ADEE|nr:DivIVA domain-containing protein [Numidum massiliense]
MSLTPMDINNKEFNRKLRGYSEEEVNEFLGQISKEYELLLKENKKLERENKDAKEKLSRFSNIEESLSKSILVAQETAEEVKSNARKESQLLVKEAEKNADRIINEALTKVRKVYMEMDDLKRRAAIYRSRLRSLVEAQLDMLEKSDWDALKEIEEEIEQVKEEVY